MLRVGDRLILEQKYTGSEEKFKCMVLETKEDHAYIDFPINLETGKAAFLVDGTELTVTFSRGEQAIYMFDKEVLGKVKGNIPMVQILLTGEDAFVKIQRRQYVRIDAVLDVAVHPEGGVFKPFRSLTEDISAGGASVRLVKKEMIEAGEILYLWMALPLKSGDIQYLRLKSKVIRLSDRDLLTPLLHLQFIDPPKSDIQILMRYIFEKQVELKNNGI